MLVQRGKQAAPLSVFLVLGHDVDAHLWLLSLSHQAFNLLAVSLLTHFNELMLGNSDLIASFDKLMLEVEDDEVDGDAVLLCLHLRAPSWHDDVRILHSRFHELLEGRLHEPMVRLQDALHRSSSLNDVTLQTAS